MMKIITICLFVLAACSPVIDKDPLSDSGLTQDSGAQPGAKPCDGFATSFLGDSQCIAAPAEDEGFQLHYGPANYDDPSETDHFLIYPGEEYVDCMFVKTPNAEDVHVNEYRARLRPGTHHMITYVQPGDVPDSIYPQNCNQGPGFTFLVGATTITTDITSFGKDAPEYKGAAMKIGAKSQAAIQLHYINITEAPILKEGWINVIYTNDFNLEVNPITWLGGIGMNIKPLTDVVTPAGGDSCVADKDLAIITLVGHAHSHTQRVSAYITRAGETNRNLIYETYDWAEPEFVYYNSFDKNKIPDATTKTPGGFTGILTAHPGDKMSWECQVHNDSALNLVFSDKALTGEMCNVFGVYAPSTGAPWSCLSF